MIFLFILLFPLLFINIVPVVATEEENIDSFDVHPVNRWSITNTTYDSAIVNDGILNMSDVGDGTADRYNIVRDLRDLDSSIEVMFMLTSNSSAAVFDNRFRIELYDENSIIGGYFDCLSIKDNAATDTRLRIIDTDGNTDSLSVDSDEDVFTDLWYRLKINYDILKTQLRFRLFFENGTKVFDYDYFDVTTDNIRFFGQTGLRLGIRSQSFTVGAFRNDFVSYVKAPFKEREWTQAVSPGDADWLQDSWQGAFVQDTVDAISAWQLTVPSLDSFSGSVIVEYGNIATISNGDESGIYVGLYGVDADDGGTHVIAQVALAKIKEGGVAKSIFEVKINGSSEYIREDNGNNFPTMSFSFALSEDRTKYELKARYTPDVQVDTVFHDVVFEGDVSDSVDDPSQEFIIEMRYDIELASDTEFLCLVEDFGFTDRDIFTDIVAAVVDPIGNFLSTIFTVAFKFLAGIFRIVGDLITAAISIATGLIETSIGLVVIAVEAVTSALGEILTAIGELAAAIATEVWDGIGDALDFITTAIAAIAEDIWIALSAAIGDILDDLLTALALVAEEAAGIAFDILEFLIVLVLDIIDGVINFIIEAVFFFWDLLGLPDLIAVYDTVIVGLIQVATSTPDMFIWLLDVWFFWATGVFFLGFLILLGFPIISSNNPGEFVNNFVDMNSMDATLGIALLGFQIKIPIGFLFWPVFFLMFLTPLL